MSVFKKEKLDQWLENNTEMKKATIMIVDDESQVVKSLENLFREEYYLFTALSGQEALDLIEKTEKTEDIAVIISDYRMPKMNGVEFFERVKEKLPNTIRIILSGYGDAAILMDAINKAKIYEFITKPFEPEDFLHRIKLAVDFFEQRKKLIHAEKMASLGVLAAGAAHEINNPATFISRSIYNIETDLNDIKDFLKEKLSGEDSGTKILETFNEMCEPIFRHLSTIKNGSKRIIDIVKDLKIYSYQEKEEMKEIKIVEGIQSTLNLVKTKYKDRIKFETDFQTDPIILGNLGELNQVFMNIIMNACEAICEKNIKASDGTMGSLFIQTIEENDCLTITFKDNGVGMSEDVKEKIYDPFFTTKDVGYGMGLGMFISFGIIKKHHGDIHIDSIENEGTTITLHIPTKKSINRREKDA